MSKKATVGICKYSLEKELQRVFSVLGDDLYCEFSIDFVAQKESTNERLLFELDDEIYHLISPMQ